MKLDRNDCLDDDTVMALLDDTVAPDDLSRIHVHLDDCDECRRVVADLARCIGPQASVPLETSLLPGTTLGRYVITRWLGTGAVGVVYEAHDTLLERHVALKVLRPDVVGAHEGRLLREAQALAALSHPNVIAVHDAGTFDDSVFIAMELVGGPTLREWSRARTEPWQSCIAKTVEAARGLAAAHAAGIVHRDFKPDNALITDDGRLVVTDFGLARGDGDTPTEDGRREHHEGDPPSSWQTHARSLVGTPAYMAPEQLRGNPATPASDQFAVCATAYELTMGCLPFSGETIEHRLQAIVGGNFQRPTTSPAPPPIVDVLRRGLSAEPDARYPSLTALADALQDGLGRAGSRPARQRRVALAVLAGTTVAGLAYRLATSEPERSCDAAQIELDWGPSQHRSVTDAIAQPGSDFAKDTASRITQSLDHYAATWVESYDSTCVELDGTDAAKAHHVYLRLACLQSRRRDLAAVVAVLTDPDPVEPQHAIRAVGELPSVSSCGDVPALERRASRNSALDPILADALDERLARATALRDSGRYAAAQDVATSVLEELRDTPPSSLEAQAQILRADALVRLNDADTGYGEYLRALELAEQLDDAHARARSLRGLAFTCALRDQYEQGLEWARLARAAAQRTGETRLMAAALSVTSAVYRSREDREQALEYSQQTLALWSGIDHPNRVVALYDAGTDLRSLRRYDEAKAALSKAREHGERILGPQHPIVGAIIGSLGVLQAQQGNHEAALPLLREGLKIRESALGTDNPSLSPVLLGLANTELNAGRPAAARPHYERCHVLAKSVVQRAYCRYGLGKALSGLDEPEASRRALAEAYEGVKDRVTGTVFAEIAFAYAETLGDDERDTGLEIARKALSLYESAGPGHQREQAEVRAWLHSHDPDDETRRDETVAGD